MKNKLYFLWIALALFALCFFASMPLLHAGFFTMHDDEQIGRLSQMYLALSQGQIPPRWLPDLGFGFGYPLFNFYPPLVYYVGSFLHFLSFSFIDATKVVMFLGFFLASLTMFIWIKKHFGIVAGFFAALLYTYAPYHSVDLYVRGALSEFFSWIWIPIIFWSVDMLFETLERKYVVLLGIFFALLMLSHTLVMLQFAPLFILYIAFTFFQKKNNTKKKALYLAMAVSLGLGLSGYFWIPSLAEKQYTLVDTILIKELANYAIHFVCPIQLWSGPWGYGGSAAGCVDGLSFQIGKIQILVGVLGGLLSLWSIFKKRNFLPSALLVIFLVSIFLTTSYSKFIWDAVPPFWYIQFPWRFLLFTAVGSAFLGGFLVFCIEKKWGRPIAICVAIALSLLALYQIRNYFRPQTFTAVTDADMTSPEQIKWYVSGLSYEYVPKDVATQKTALGTTQLAISKSDIPTRAAVGVSGKINVRIIQDISYLKKLQINVYNQGIVQLNTYAFPGWEVFVNGKKVDRFVKNRLDLIQVALPTGTYTIIARFSDTPVRVLANILSIISGICLVGFFIWSKYKKI